MNMAQAELLLNNPHVRKLKEVIEKKKVFC